MNMTISIVLVFLFKGFAVKKSVKIANGAYI